MSAVVLGEIAAVAATGLAAFGAAPQVRRLWTTRDLAGVSLSAAMVGMATEVVWAAYSISRGLWSAVPESVLMTVANGLVAATAIRAGARTGVAVAAAGCWGLVLGALAGAGGVALLGMILGFSYVLQAAPAVWAVYRAVRPSGVAVLTWLVVAGEAVLWGGYGLAHGDPATVTFGVIALLSAAAIVTRTVRVPVSRCAVVAG